MLTRLPLQAGYATILYFIDSQVVKSLEEQFPPYASNFSPWAQQSVGMLQSNVWVALKQRFDRSATYRCAWSELEASAQGFQASQGDSARLALSYVLCLPAGVRLF